MPDLAMDEHLAGGRQWSARDSDFADQALRAGGHFGAPRLQSNAHEEDGDGPQRDADGQGRPHFDAHLWDGPVDQQEGAERQQSDAAYSEGPVGGELRL